MKKKANMSLESPSIRSYIHIVKQILLNNLILLVSILSLYSRMSLAEQVRAVFIVLNSGVELTEANKQLESLGCRVKQTVPPNIIVAETPKSVNPGELPIVEAAYFNSIAIRQLKSFGPIGMAAGIEWNKSLPAQHKSPQANGLGAMNAAAIKQTLPAPEMLAATFKGPYVHCQWESAPGAMLSEIELSANAQFSNVLRRGKTDKSFIDFPIPDIGLPMTGYLRVRHRDRPDATNASLDIQGEWSEATPVRIDYVNQIQNQPIPVLTSPLDEYDSLGFTVILEWNTKNTDRSQLQLSSTEDFASPWMDISIEGHEFVVPSSTLHVGDVVFWRVKTFDGATSEWSSARKFMISEPSHHSTDMFINPEAPQ
jgi:hypothetical protein